MSREAQRVYLINKMKARESDLAIPIGYPNQPFNIPKNAAYGEFYILGGDKGLIISGEGTGQVRMRYVGLVQLTVYLPRDSGTKVANVASDVFESVFQLKQGRDAAQSTYKFGIVQDFTPVEKAGYECFIYRVPFQRDTIGVVEIVGGP